MSSNANLSSGRIPAHASMATEQQLMMQATSSRLSDTPMQLDGSLRSLTFWRRAGTIYLAFKAAQLRAMFMLAAGWSKEQVQRVIWHPHHQWAGKAMHSLALDLRGFYLKVGQFLGARRDFVPEAICKQLCQLHDQVPPMGPEAVRAIIERELQAPLEALFQEFDLQEPLGAASIAQVHRARLAGTGQEVAVKVQYQDALGAMLQDIGNIRAAAGFLSRVELKFDLLSPMEELASQIRLEFDFVHEAKVMDTIADHLQDMKSLAVPHSIPSMVTSNVLVMSFLHGEQITRIQDHLRHMTALQREEAARDIMTRLCEAYGRMLLLEGLFQADCHPGNILVMEGGRVGLIDYGQSKQLSQHDRLALANLVIALDERDTPRISDSLSRLGVRTAGSDQKLRARMAFAMFDTSGSADPFSKDSPLKQMTVDKFPSEMFFVLRVVQLLRGLATSMGVEDFSTAHLWKPLAVQALQARRQQLRQQDWRRALVGDTWFTEGGFMLGGRSGRDLSWFKTLARPRWSMPTYMCRPIWVAQYACMAACALLLWRAPPRGFQSCTLPLSLLAGQLACSLAWSLLFYRLRRIDLALLCSCFHQCLLWAATLTVHWAQPPASRLLVPSCAFATFLWGWNHFVWRRNRVAATSMRMRLAEATARSGGPPSGYWPGSDSGDVGISQKGVLPPRKPEPKQKNKQQRRLVRQRSAGSGLQEDSESLVWGPPPAVDRASMEGSNSTPGADAYVSRRSALGSNFMRSTAQPVAPMPPSHTGSTSQGLGSHHGHNGPGSLRWPGAGVGGGSTMSPGGGSSIGATPGFGAGPMPRRAGPSACSIRPGSKAAAAARRHSAAAGRHQGCTLLQCRGRKLHLLRTSGGLVRHF